MLTKNNADTFMLVTSLKLIDKVVYSMIILMYLFVILMIVVLYTTYVHY